MTNHRISASIALVAAAALLTACGDSDTATTPTTSAAPITTPAGADQLQKPEPAERTPAPETSAPQESTGPCVDPASPMVTDALASLGATAPGGSPWIAGAYSDVTGSCGELLWLMAETPGGTASSPSHVLFFRDGTYLGTATSDSYSYTHVVGADGSTVSVQYRWLDPEDANCCPSGGPAVIDYTWDGSQVVMQPPLPQQMLDSYGPR
ncbi:LppP/LprE family lipoprotein [Rhodococcus sp. NPDC060086]|uniref:LppP/LprE family lipoprotein n=1 Tax=Rhodococcus sp. NPDC060086 TaxID=3347055 RepID=UPI00364897B7